MSENQITTTGELIVWEEEGGYCSPYLAIFAGNDEVSFEGMIEKILPDLSMSGGHQGVTVKVTIEVVGEAEQS